MVLQDLPVDELAHIAHDQLALIKTKGQLADGLCNRLSARGVQACMCNNENPRWESDHKVWIPLPTAVAMTVIARLTLHEQVVTQKQVGKLQVQQLTKPCYSPSTRDDKAGSANYSPQ